MSAGATRILIACARCKSRKIRCDGSTPKCGHCETRGLHCVYAAARQYRGPGKRRAKAGNDAKTSHDATKSCTPGGIESAPLASGASLARDVISLRLDSDEETTPAIPVSIVTAAVESIQPQAARTLFPSFLLPGAYESHMTVVKTSIDEAETDHKPTPLLPLEISKRLLQNSLDEMQSELPFLGDKASILSLLEGQYADSSLAPGSRPDRWALVNTVLAIAIRHKMAASAEAQLSGIASAFFKNATMVTHQLILRDPTAESIHALRAMAAFAKGMPDLRAQAVLLANAEHQQKMIDRGITGV